MKSPIMSHSASVPFRFAVIALLVGALGACATNSGLDRSRLEFPDGDPVVALSTLEQRVRQEPRNRELRAYYLRQRERVVAEYLLSADQARAREDFDQAEQSFRQALSVDANDPRAMVGLESLADERRRFSRLVTADKALARGDFDAAERLARSVAAEAPSNARAQRLLRDADERRLLDQSSRTPSVDAALRKTVSLQFRDAPLRAVFEVLSHAAGLNFVFDREIRDDVLVTLILRDTPVDEVLRLVAATQQIETKMLNGNTVLIYPATPAKQREYQSLVSRSFYLVYADAKQAQALLKQIVKTRDVFMDEKLNLLVIKDTPEAVRLAERLIATLDVAEPEVMLDLQVLEVSRTKLRDIGLELPQSIGYGLLEDGDSGTLVSGNVNLRRSSLVPYVANPAALLRLVSEDSDTSTLANPRIRVKNRVAAKIHIGDKLPVFTTTSTANVGVSASVSYLDIGLKLDVEPSVTLDDQVAIKVGLEVSSIVNEVSGPQGSLAYRIGSRSTTTTLRLRNGETQVLAGLINDEERLNAQRLPGLGDIPVLGRLFSAKGDNSAKTEIVLLITPRILRNVVPPVAARENLYAGTDASVGAAPLRLGATAPGSLTVRGGAVAGGGAGIESPGPIAFPNVPPGPVPEPVAPSGGSRPEGVAVQLIAPPTVRPNAVAMLRVDTGGRGSFNGGSIDLTYDANLLEPVGFTTTTPGTASVALPGGTLPASVQLSFLAKPGSSGTAAVAVTGMTLDAAGQRMNMPVSASATITISTQ